MSKSIQTSWVRWVVCVIVCSSGMSYGVNRYILVPIQDQLMDWYNINDVEYNLLMSLYSWPNIIFSISCGILVDKFGVRKMLTLSWILNFIGLSVIIYSCIYKDYMILCIGRVIVGIGNEGLSLTLKIYVIEFFRSSEYSIVFGIYLGFISIGSGINTIVSFQTYKYFGIEYAMALPLIIAPFVAMPLFLLLFIEHFKISHLFVVEIADESTQLMIATSNQQKEINNLNNKFKLSDIKEFPLYFWILLIGFVIWCGAAQSSLNIGISFTHHMYGVSHEEATFISIYGTVLSIICYFSSGVLTAIFGRKMEMLIVAAICSIIKNIINGWITFHIAFAFIAGAFSSPSIGITYPVVWAAIPLLVSEKVRGTAFGFATSTRFGTIAICYIFVGLLTREESGNKKYIDVQVFLVGLSVVCLIFYCIEFYLDIEYNNSVLRKVHKKKHVSATKHSAELSMKEIIVSKRSTKH